MASAGRNLMNTNTGPQDSYLFDDSMSPWLPEKWSTISNFHRETKEFSPSTSSTSPGGKTTFQIQQTLADYLGDVYLSLRISITAGSGGTYQRFMDFLGYAAIQRIEIKQGSNLVRVIDGLDLQVYYHRMLMDRDEAAATSELVFGDKTAAERLTAATTTGFVDVFVRIPWHYTDTHKYFPISVLGSELTFEITYSAADRFYQTDHSTLPVVSFSNQKLIMDLIHVPSDEQAYLQQNADMNEGLLYLFHEIADKHSSVTIPSGSTSFTLQLNQMKSPVVELVFVVRKSSNVNNANPINDLFVFEQIQDFKITGSSLDVVVTKTDSWCRWKEFPQFHSGVPGDYIYFHSFSICPEDERDHNGSLNFFNLTAASITINFASAIGEAYILDIIPVTRNIDQVRSGDYKKIFV